MKKLLIGILAMCTLSTFAEKNFIDQNYIEVTARAEKEIAPDEIYLRIVLDESNYKNQSLAELEKKLVAALEKSGVVVDKQLRIKDLSSDFTKKFLRKKATTVQEYSLLITETTTLMRVFHNLDAAGFSDFEIEKLDHSEIEDLRREVTIEAMKNATLKASDLAQAVGQTAGRALYIYENEGNSYAPRYNKVMLMSAESATMDTSMPALEFEAMKITSSVTVRFELK